MMRARAAVAVLALLLGLQPALAQTPNVNFIVPTAPLGTMNNQAASTEFVQNSVAAGVSGVGSIGGAVGIITLGSGLSVPGNALTNTGVLSLDGRTGALLIGSGITRSGSTFSNSGVLSLGGAAGALSLGTGLSMAGSTLNAAVRLRLAAPTAFYVDSSVSANVPGCGLAPGASACKTIQYFADILANQYDCGGNAAVIQLAHGTYAPVSLSQAWTGCPAVILQGDLASQSSVIVDGAGGAYCVQVSNYAVLTVQGLTVQNCANEIAASERYGQIYFQNITFNAPTNGGTGVYCSRNSYCEVVGFGNIINWPAAGPPTGAYFIEASHQGTFRAATGNTPAQPFTLAADFTVGSFIYVSSLADATFTLYAGSPFNLNGHTVTGRTWTIDSGGLIQTLITSSVFFPGSVSGLMHGSGVYNGPIHIGTAIFAGGGAGPSMVGDDYDGVVTEGAGSTGVVLTFGSAFDTAPVCTISYLSAVTSPVYATSINTLGTTHAAGAATFAYRCRGG